MGCSYFTKLDQANVAEPIGSTGLCHTKEGATLGGQRKNGQRDVQQVL